MTQTRPTRAADIRRACRAYAERFIGVMSEEFKRLCVSGQWNEPYLTMRFRYQADIVRALGKFVERDIVYARIRTAVRALSTRTVVFPAIDPHESHVVRFDAKFVVSCAKIKTNLFINITSQCLLVG